MSDFTVSFVLDANDTGLRTALNRTEGDARKLNQTLGGTRTSAKGAGDSLGGLGTQAQRASAAVSPLATQLQQLRGALAGYLGLRGFQILGREADAYANMSAQIRVAVGASGDFAQAQADVFAIAQRTSTQLNVVGGLYARLSNGLRDIGVSQREVALMTERIGQAFVVSGASAAESAGAIRQLTQAFASGVLRGEEFNSVNEQGPRIMQALAASMGVTRGELRKMAEAGELTSDRLRTALLGIQGDQIAREFEQIPITIGRAWTQVTNSFQRFIGQTDEAIGASRVVVTVLQGLSANMDVLAAGVLALAAAMSVRLVASLTASASAFLVQRAAALSAAAAITTANVAVGASIGVATTSAAAMGVLATAARGLAAALGPIAIALTAVAWLSSLAEASDHLTDATRETVKAVRDATQAQYDNEPARLAAIAGAREEAQVQLELAAAVAEAAAAKSFSVGIGRMFWTEEDRAASRDAQANLARLRQLVQETDEEFGAAALGGLQQFISGLLQVKAITDATNYSDVVSGLKDSVVALEAQKIGMTQGAEAALRFKIATELGVDASADLGEELEALIARSASLTGSIAGLTAAKRTNRDAAKEAAKAAREWRQELEDLAGAVLVDTAAQQLMRLALAMEEAERAGNPSLVLQLSRAYDMLAEQLEETEFQAAASASSLRGLKDPVADLLKSYQQEAALIGLTADARRRHESIIEAERRARDAIHESILLGNDYTDQERAGIIEASKARAAWIEDLKAAAEQAQVYQALVSQAFNQVADVIGDAFTGGIRSASEFADRMKAIAKQMVAQMIAEYLKLRVLGPLLSSLFGGGAGGGGGSILGAVGSAAIGAAGGGSGGAGSLGAASIAAGGGGGGAYTGILQSLGGGSGRLLNPSTWANLGRNLYSGFSQAWNGSGRVMQGSQYFGQATYGPGMQTGYAPTALGYGAAALGGLYAGYGRWQDNEPGAGRFAGAAAYGIGTYTGAMALGGIASGAGAAAGVAGGFGAMGAAAAVPVIGWIALIAMVVDMVAGGKLFGTAYKPDEYQTTLGIGAGGGVARMQVREERQTALFGGRRARYRDLEVPDEMQRAADEFFRGIVRLHEQSARLLNLDGLAPIIEGAFTQVFDAYDDNPLKREFGEILGRTFEEPIEQFRARLAGANILSSIAAALTADQIGVGRFLGYGDDEAGGGGDPNVPIDRPGGALKSVSDALAQGSREIEVAAHDWDESFSAVMAIAARWDATGEEFLAGAQFLLAAAVDMVNGFGLLAEEGTLAQITDLVEDYQAESETLLQTYQRLQQGLAMLNFALDLAGVSLKMTAEQMVRFGADIVEAAGGLEQAQTLWQRFFEGFYSQGELLEQQLAMAEQARNRLAEGLGIDPEMSLADFRQAFEDALPTLSPEEVVQWLQLGDAMLTVDEITRQLGETMRDAGEGSRQLGSEFYEAMRAIIVGANDAAAAAREQGASEGALAIIHINAARRVAQAIEILRAQTQDLISRLYGGLPGTLDEVERQIRDLESGLGESFGGGIGDVSTQLDNLFQRWQQGLQGIQDWIDSVLLNQGLTTLTPEQQMNEAGAQFQAALLAAQGGDADALASLPGLANQFLTLARGFYSSGDDYQAIFDQVMASMQGLGGLTNPGGSLAPGVGGPGGQQLVGPSPELVALYEQRDALMAAQTEAMRAQLALDLAGHLRDLAGALGTPVLELMDLMGVSIEELAADLGVNMEDLTGASVEAMALMASLLGISLTELTDALGLELTDLGEGLTELTGQLGIDLGNLTVESTRSLAALAASLGIDLSEMATALGLDLGELADAQSLLNQALAAEINALPESQRDELQPLLDAITNATTEADANAAIEALEAAVALMSPDLQDRLAPYLEGIIPSPLSADVRELVTANTWLSSMDDLLYDSKEYLRQIAESLSGGVQAAAGVVPQYSTGAALITQGGIAGLHSGEGVVDQQAWSYLQAYGIQVTGQDSSGAAAAEVHALREDTRRGNDRMLDTLEGMARRLERLEDASRDEAAASLRLLDKITT